MKKQPSDEQVALAYACWIFNMWSQNFGSHRDIEWAVNMRLLCPLRHPGKRWGSFVKWCIRLHKKYEESRLADMECDLDLEYSGEAE